MQPARTPQRSSPQPIPSQVERTPARRTSRGSADPPLVLLDPALQHAPKRRTTVILLCLFLGWMGCHRFYVGKRRSGRIYLLTSGLLFFGVFVDLILILTGAFEDRFGQPLV